MTSFSINDQASEENAVRAVEIAYDAAWTAGDAGALLALFTPDAVIINPYGEVWQGLTQIEPALKAFLAGEGAGSSHSSRLKVVFFVTPEVALVEGEATLVGKNFNGGALVHRFTDVLVKRQSVWRINQVRAYTFMPRNLTSA
ncbi:MAG TPA: SgcJ/EcaC family oxidoreductase [Anaerolineaceae bacterium]|nr:SgcJ/EcaC family oxidoreductase [Anaerolineaceae bacterium]